MPSQHHWASLCIFREIAWNCIHFFPVLRRASPRTWAKWFRELVIWSVCAVQGVFSFSSFFFFKLWKAVLSPSVKASKVRVRYFECYLCHFIQTCYIQRAGEMICPEMLKPCQTLVLSNYNASVCALCGRLQPQGVLLFILPEQLKHSFEARENQAQLMFSFLSALQDSAFSNLVGLYDLPHHHCAFTFMVFDRRRYPEWLTDVR